METDRTRMISLRMNKNVLRDVDRYVRNRRYLSRSRVIELCVTAFMQCATEGSKQRLFESLDPYDDGLVVSVSKPI